MKQSRFFKMMIILDSCSPLKQLLQSHPCSLVSHSLYFSSSVPERFTKNQLIKTMTSLSIRHHKVLNLLKTTYLHVSLPQKIKKQCLYNNKWTSNHSKNYSIFLSDTKTWAKSVHWRRLCHMIENRKLVSRKTSSQVMPCQSQDPFHAL